MDDRCARPADLAARFECLGLAWAGAARDCAAGRPVWASLRANRRLSYMTAAVAAVVLLLAVVSALVGRRQHFRASTR